MHRILRFAAFLTIFLVPSAVDAVDCTRTYTVQEGDNCGYIADMYKLNTDEFMNSNGIDPACKYLPVSNFSIILSFKDIFDLF